MFAITTEAMFAMQVDAEAVRAQRTLDDALWRAVVSRDAQGVADALSAGAQVDARLDVGDPLSTPLLFASQKGCHDVCRLLLEAGADVNARDSDDVTPLMFAATYGDLDVVELLVAADADLSLCNRQMRRALDVAASNPRVLQLLLENGDDANRLNDRGETALHSAAVVLHTSVAMSSVQLLLAYGADPTIQRQEDGKTAFDIAAQRETRDLLEYLRDYSSAQRALREIRGTDDLEGLRPL